MAIHKFYNSKRVSRICIEFNFLKFFFPKESFASCIDLQSDVSLTKTVDFMLIIVVSLNYNLVVDNKQHKTRPSSCLFMLRSGQYPMGEY